MKVRERPTSLKLKVNRLFFMFGGLTMLVVFSGTGPAPARERPAASSASASVSDWQRYEVKGQEFSARFPVVPAMNTFDRYIDKLQKHRSQSMITAYADGVVYAIYTFENPNRRQPLDEVITEFYTNETGHDITRDGFHGKEFSHKTSDLSSESQFYITEQSIYLFSATGSTLGNAVAGIPKFFSSIKLTKKPKGIALVNGPGEQPNAAPAGLNGQNETRVLTGKEVSGKARVVAKPEPEYTEEARKSQIQGTVVLRVVFSSAGAVTNIRAVSGLPNGLTERAIAAARQIRFIPATKDGHFVSMYIQLEYNFNLY